MLTKSSAGLMSIVLLLSSRMFGGGQIDADRDPKWPQQLQHALDLESVGDFAEAERTLIGSIHNAEQPRSDPAWLPTALDRLGVLNWDLGRTRQAEQFYLRAADLWQTRFGRANLGLATTLSDLAWVYVALGNASRAASLWQHSIEIRTGILGAFHPTVAQVYGYMAVAAFGANQVSEAESSCQKALQIYERSGKVAGETDQVLSTLASVRIRQRRTAEAVQLLNEAIDLEQTAKHSSIRLLGGYFYNLALAESAAARPADAEAHFQRALSLLAAPPYASEALRCNVLYSYAQFLSGVDRKKEARIIQKQATNLAQLIRRQSYIGYADVSSFR